jgi:hypothetical protein
MTAGKEQWEDPSTRASGLFPDTRVRGRQQREKTSLRLYRDRLLLIAVFKCFFLLPERLSSNAPLDGSIHNLYPSLPQFSIPSHNSRLSQPIESGLFPAAGEEVSHQRLDRGISATPGNESTASRYNTKPSHFFDGIAQGQKRTFFDNKGG